MASASARSARPPARRHGDGVSPAVAGESARAAAQDFEAVFLNSMFSQMLTHVSEGPFSGSEAAGDLALVPHQGILQELRQGRRHRHCRQRLQQLIALQEARAK